MANPLLYGIFKASQCCDLNDFEIAIKETKDRIARTNSIRGNVRGLYHRLHSLEKGLKKKHRQLFELYSE